MGTQFSVSHVLNISPDGFWTHIQPSEDFYRALYIEHLGFEYELLECDLAAGTRKARIKPSAEAPRVIREALGERFSFIEAGHYIAADKVYNFEIVPNTFTEKVITKATQIMAPIDGEPNKCMRKVDFEITASVFAIGGVLEKFIAKTTRDSYDDSAKFTNDYLAKHGL